MIQIVVYGSNSVLLAGLVSILNCQSNLEVVGSFLDRISSIQVSDCQADLFLLEQTPQIDLWWLERWLSEADFELGGILLTDSITIEEMSEYLHLGFKGFLPRLLNTEEITATIDAVIAGLIVIHPAITAKSEDSAITPLPELEIPLTAREVEILQLLGAGLDNKAIASSLQISKHTVKFHISSILSKLNVSSRTQAVTLGLRQGLIRL